VTGTLAYVFVGVALLCVVAGVAAVSRTRRRVRDADESGEDDGGATYAEEAAAVAAAQAAAAAAASPDDDEVDGIGPA
jgi:hypothetical protein